MLLNSCESALAEIEGYLQSVSDPTMDLAHQVAQLQEQNSHQQASITALAKENRALTQNIAQLGVMTLQPEDVLLALTPLFHAASMWFLIAPHQLAARVHILPMFDQGKVLDAIETRAVTFTLAVPTNARHAARAPRVRTGAVCVAAQAVRIGSAFGGALTCCGVCSR